MGTLPLQLSSTNSPLPKPSPSIPPLQNSVLVTQRPSTACGALKSSGPASDQRSRLHNSSNKYNSYDTDSGGGGAFAKHKRVWWVDDDDEDDYDDDDDDWMDGDGPDRFSWIFKILRSFGWMFPALAVAMLMGTGGTNAFFMALAVPLGQTALSLVLDKVWESSWSNSRPRRRAKTKKKPFAGTSGHTNTSTQKAKERKTAETRGSYQSWVATASKKARKRETRFGGWDDLDERSNKIPRGTPSENFERRAEHQEKVKLSRKGRVHDKPLLIRLLVAVFPFLGSWTKLFWFTVIPD